MKSVRKTYPGSLERAIEIAMSAHAGVTDKVGAPYILHPLRVMFSLKGDLARIVAVLHDVVEDSDEWTFDRLSDNGFSHEVIDALRAVTKLPEEEDEPTDSANQKAEKYFQFVQRAAAHPIGRLVKLADINDNLDITRLPTITEKDARRLSKYIAARNMLMEQT